MIEREREREKERERERERERGKERGGETRMLRVRERTIRREYGGKKMGYVKEFYKQIEKKKKKTQSYFD